MASTLERADRDLVALTVLALLRTGPRHPYEMHRLVVDTHKDFVTGLPRSLYHAVDRLLARELVRVHATESDGPRPERTVYAITEAGGAALAERLSRLLAVPTPDATLLGAALSLVGGVPPAVATGALRTRAATLTATLDAADATLASLSGSLPRFVLLDAEFDRERVRAERDWVAALVDDLEAGRVEWPDDPAALAGLLMTAGQTAGEEPPAMTP